MNPIKKIMTPRDVAILMLDLSNSEKLIFFEIYSYNMLSKTYTLKDRKRLKDIGCKLSEDELTEPEYDKNYKED